MAGFSYRAAPRSVRMAATAFLLLALAGFGVVGLQVYVTAGLTARGTLAHYRGDESTLQTPMGFAQLVEITHAHAYTIPLLSLALSVAFLLTEAPERLKQLVVSSLWTGAALELGLPWLVRYGPAWTVHAFDLVGVLLGAGLLAAVARPLWEMWGRPRTP